MRTIVFAALLLAGCSSMPDPCPALPTLPDPATRADRDRWIEKTAAIYSTCAASKRPN